MSLPPDDRVAAELEKLKTANRSGTENGQTLIDQRQKLQAAFQSKRIAVSKAPDRPTKVGRGKPIDSNRDRTGENPFDNPTTAQEPASKQPNQLEACLRQFLDFIAWDGEDRQLFEALPHFDRIDSIASLQSVLFRLNFQSTLETASSNPIHEDFLPCFFIRQDGHAFLLEQSVDGADAYRAYDGATGAHVVLAADALTGSIVFPEIFDTDGFADDYRKFGWVRIAFAKFKPLLFRIFAVSFLINFLALFVPIYVMNVYDKAIGAKSLDVLRDFSVGICIVIAADLSLRILRSKAQAYLGARLDTLIGNAGFQQLLHMLHHNDRGGAGWRTDNPPQAI